MEAVLKAYRGGLYTLPPLTEWEVTLTGSVPCDSFSVTCPYRPEMAAALEGAYRVRLTEADRFTLNAVVDEYEIAQNRQGRFVTVRGRGLAALLLDNESEAITYERALLAEVLGNHVSPYGIQVDVRRDVSGDSYAVASGSSQWKALQGFTRRFGGFDPYFTREGILVAAPLWGSGSCLQVDDNTPLLSLRKREDRYGVISEVLIQDKVQGVSHQVVNRAFTAAGGRRRHVLYMPRSTPDTRRYTGEYQIAQSAAEQLEIEAELPFPFAAFPGDRAGLALKRLNLSGQYEVVRSRSRMDGDGARTELTLSVR